jgi:hypothetical protein
VLYDRIKLNRSNLRIGNTLNPNPYANPYPLTPLTLTTTLILLIPVP